MYTIPDKIIKFIKNAMENLGVELTVIYQIIKEVKRGFMKKD